MPNFFTSLLERSRQRKVHAELLRLDDHLLRDLGITRSDVHSLMAGRGRRTTRWHE